MEQTSKKLTEEDSIIWQRIAARQGVKSAMNLRFSDIADGDSGFALCCDAFAWQTTVVREVISRGHITGDIPRPSLRR